MGERAVFVGQWLVDLILKGVGVHRVEPKVVLRRFLPQGVVIAYFIPWDVGRDGAGASRQLLDDAAIFQLVMDAARLPKAGEAGEPCAAGADAPGRDGDGPGNGTGGQRLNIKASAGQLAAQSAEIILVRGVGIGIQRADQVGGDHICHRLPRKGHGIARVHVQEIAGGFVGNVRGEEIDTFRDILGEDRPLQQAALAVMLFQFFHRDLV